MGWGSLGNELVNSMGQPKGQQAQKIIRGKDVVIGLRKPIQQKVNGSKRGKEEVNGPKKLDE